MKSRLVAVSVVLSAAGLLAACSGMSHRSSAFSQDGLPDSVKVPAGHRVAMETVGVGEITYECRAKASQAGAHEWVFVGPKADLNRRTGGRVGTYYGPPATWAADDGSAVTGKQLAVAPGSPGSIAMQLVKADPATGMGAMRDVTYIQRVATRGGVAPSTPCDGNGVGRREIVKYQADYIFWKAA